MLFVEFCFFLCTVFFEYNLKCIVDNISVEKNVSYISHTLIFFHLLSF